MDSALAGLAGTANVRTIIDIGAARGDWTRLAAQHFPDRSYLMIDPLIENEPALRNVCAVLPNAQYELAAVGSATNPIAFSVTNDLDGSGIYDASDDGYARPRMVQQITLDEAATKHNVGGPFLLKLDTHGYELPILAGARAVLQQTDAIVMECYFFHVSPTACLLWEICQEMSALGFRVADLVDPFRRPKDGMLWQVDLVFLRTEHRNFVDESYG
jgi:FkbM family methyltransferase